MATLDDRPWIFEISWRLYYQYVQPYLTIPATPH